ncbi:hypothetical protein L1987_05399 [Smallanthus sonchifolius]|uniref:Uncharacterized protein n=1 Tax=Smallanthus sonchifolius TaxID=185202 RepID=A0ACB9JVJ1_9ASTR|nr:hypothetical protein L1987_05399 [Smallanthus sonchifolius]
MGRNHLRQLQLCYLYKPPFQIPHWNPTFRHQPALSTQKHRRSTQLHRRRLTNLANLTLLEQVILDGNNFTSIPPDFFTGLNNLQSFSVSDNRDLSPWIHPETLNQNSNLQSFQASNANIMGSIPDIFESLHNLQNLRLSYNNLTGTLPRSFAGSQIQNLWLNNQNQGLSGTLDVISSMTQLNQVWLQANSFTEAIPDLSNCIVLFDLQLRDNQLTDFKCPEKE